MLIGLTSRNAAGKDEVARYMRRIDRALHEGSKTVVRHQHLQRGVGTGHQGSGAVHHGGVYHLALAGAFRFQQCTDHAVGQHQSAADEGGWPQPRQPLPDLLIAENHVPEAQRQADDHPGGKAIAWLIVTVHHVHHGDDHRQGQRDIGQGVDKGRSLTPPDAQGRQLWHDQ